jgi:hypothetical protein
MELVCMGVLKMQSIKKWSFLKCALCAIQIIISAYLPEIEYLHLNLKPVTSSF